MVCSELQQYKPKCLLLNGTSLSAPAQTTLYYLTIPTEGYLIWWTPFATRPTPSSTIQQSFEIVKNQRQMVFANNVHSPVCHFVPSFGTFPLFLPKTISSPGALHYLMYSDSARARAVQCFLVKTLQRMFGEMRIAAAVWEMCPISAETGQ